MIMNDEFVCEMKRQWSVLDLSELLNRRTEENHDLLSSGTTRITTLDARYWIRCHSNICQLKVNGVVVTIVLLPFWDVPDSIQGLLAGCTNQGCSAFPHCLQEIAGVVPLGHYCLLLYSS